MEGYVQITRALPTVSAGSSLEDALAEARGADEWRQAMTMQFLVGTPIPEHLKRFAPAGVTCPCGPCAEYDPDWDAHVDDEEEDPAS